jgi:hypothetical protein
MAGYSPFVTWRLYLALEKQQEYRFCIDDTNQGAAMKHTLLSLAILLTATGAPGQSSLTWSHSLNPGNCPVALQADHAGLFLKRDVNDPLTQPTGLNQRIHLTVTNLSPHSIVSADVTAHGLSEKWRFVPLTTGQPVPDLVKQIKVVLEVKGNDRASQDLAFNHFATVTSIDVNAVSYADGSSWHAAAPGACSVTPSPLMLVSSSQ